MIMLLLIGFLLLAGVALMLLDIAIEYAEEGYEDDSGFHQTSRQRPAQSPSEGEITPWDQIEGACCPLNIGPSYHPAQGNSFTPHP